MILMLDELARMAGPGVTVRVALSVAEVQFLRGRCDLARVVFSRVAGPVWFRTAYPGTRIEVWSRGDAPAGRELYDVRIPKVPGATDPAARRPLVMPRTAGPRPTIREQFERAEIEDPAPFEAAPPGYASPEVEADAPFERAESPDAAARRAAHVDAFRCRGLRRDAISRRNHDARRQLAKLGKGAT